MRKNCITVEKCSIPFSGADGLKILSDSSSIEIISNNGEFALSSNAFLKVFER